LKTINNVKKTNQSQKIAIRPDKIIYSIVFQIFTKNKKYLNIKNHLKNNAMKFSHDDMSLFIVRNCLK